MDGVNSFTVYKKNLEQRKRDAWANLEDSKKRLKNDQAAYDAVLQEEQSFEVEVKSLMREL
jgi:hypothetical protein